MFSRSIDDRMVTNMLPKTFKAMETWDGKPLPIYSKSNEKIGQIASGIYSPRIKKNVGLSMILKNHWEIGQNVIVKTLDGSKHEGIITTLPFPK